MEPITKSARILIRPPQGLPSALVVEYLDRCRTSLPLLKAAADQGQHEQARILGHRMKGTGAPYGFSWLTEIGALIEHAAADHENSDLRKHVAALEEYLSQVDIAPE